jgi:hypothetical protein
MWHILAVLAFALAFIFHAFGFGHNPLDYDGMISAGLFFFAFGFLWPWQPWHRPPQ